MRLDRPIGIWLLLLPGLWGIILGTGGISKITPHSLWVVFLFCIGAVVMRGAGCIVNDLWDKDLDIMVERTRNRPLAAEIISPRKAFVFLATLLLISFVILIQLNKTTIFLGFLSLPFIALYPFMKRITWWPQAFLGLTFNFSALMGWSAITDEIGVVALLLYMAGIFWTLGYDTIYAHQDKEDDAFAGIKSTALKFGDQSKIYVGVFYALSLICIFMAKDLSPASIIVALPALHFIWQLKSWDLQSQESALKIFKSNTVAGILVLLFLAI